MTPRVYLASRFSRRGEMRERAAELRAIGCDVASNWIWSEEAWPEGGSATDARRRAGEDLADLLTSDMVISFTEPPRAAATRGGRHVELGVALATGKRCLVVGHHENLFHHFEWVEFHATWADALGSLREERLLGRSPAAPAREWPVEFDVSATARDAAPVALAGSPPQATAHPERTRLRVLSDDEGGEPPPSVALGPMARW